MALKVTVFSSHQKISISFWQILRRLESALLQQQKMGGVEKASTKSHMETKFCYSHAALCQQATRNQLQ